MSEDIVVLLHVRDQLRQCETSTALSASLCFTFGGNCFWCLCLL